MNIGRIILGHFLPVILWSIFGLFVVGGGFIFAQRRNKPSDSLDKSRNDWN